MRSRVVLARRGCGCHSFDASTSRPLQELQLLAHTVPKGTALVDDLSASDTDRFDDALLAKVSADCRKVARIVGSAMATVRERYKGIPDVYFAQRLRQLAPIRQKGRRKGVVR